jgi:hypothetical protein
MLDGDTLNGGITPFPIKVAVCGLLGKLSLTLRVAPKLPDVVGEKVTVTLQVALAARELGQLLVCEKASLFVPLIAIAAMLIAAVSELVSVTVCAELAPPTYWFSKLRLAGVSVTPRMT